MTSTRSSKWVLFSALQREGRRMSVWLALFPFLGFLYALCHGLLQALMNQDTDTVAAQDQTVRIFGSIALFLSAATIMAGAFFAISAFRFLYSRRQSDFYLSLPVTRRTFYFFKWVIGELVLLLAFCGAGIGCWLLPLQRRRLSTVFVCYAPLRQARCGNTGPCLSVSAAVCPWD